MRFLGRVVLAGVALAGPAAGEPSCVEECRLLSERGQLREGVNQLGCEVRVCQERGRNLYLLARYDEALEALEYLQPRLESSPSWNLDLGVVLYALGRQEEAVEAFDVTLRAFPDSVRARSQRGHALLRLGRFDEALRDFEVMLGKPGSEGEFKGLRTRSYLLGSVGVLWLLRGDLGRGRASLEEAVEVDGRNQLAGTYLHRIVPEIESGVLDSTSLFTRVVAYEEIGLRSYDRAAAELDRLTKGAPRLALGYTLLADVLRRSRDFAECERALRRGVEVLPDNPELRAQRIRCTLLRAGPTSPDAQPALVELRELREKYPDNRLIQEILIALDRG